MEFILRITPFPIAKPYVCNLNCTKIYVLEFLSFHILLRSASWKLEEIRWMTVKLASIYDVPGTQLSSGNDYCSLFLTSQYVGEDISLRTGMKTCIAQPSTLYKPVRSCKIFWKFSAALLDCPCTHALLKLAFSSGVPFFVDSNACLVALHKACLAWYYCMVILWSKSHRWRPFCPAHRTVLPLAYMVGGGPSVGLLG